MHCVYQVSSNGFILKEIRRINFVGRQGKAGLTSRAVTSTGVCTNSYGGAYANWWTYSMLLLNWFVLFCFVPYVINRFNLSKILVVIIIAMMILSFIFVIIFAVLWGVQCTLKKSLASLGEKLFLGIF